MAIDRTYRCDLCRETLTLDGDRRRAFGIHWQGGRGWLNAAARGVERHLCALCISSIQALPPVCGEGFECTGGPRCGSDHK
jgi:hypothetical protein